MLVTGLFLCPEQPQGVAQSKVTEMTNTMKTNGVNHRTLKVKNLVNPELNRIPRASRIKKMVEYFDWLLFGTLTVLKIPGKNKYWVVDGGHRLTAVLALYAGTRDANGKEIEVPCVVLPAGSDLCEYFQKLNTNCKEVSPLDRFRANFLADNAPETTIYQILASVGEAMVFDHKGGHAALGQTKCAPRWLELYDTCGRSKFEELVEMMLEVWGRPDQDTVEPTALRGDFLAGLNFYMKRTTYSVSQMGEKLKETDASSHDIRVWAHKNFPPVSGWSRIEAYALQIDKLIGGYKPKTKKGNK